MNAGLLFSVISHTIVGILGLYIVSNEAVSAKHSRLYLFGISMYLIFFVLVRLLVIYNIVSILQSLYLTSTVAIIPVIVVGLRMILNKK